MPHSRLVPYKQVIINVYPDFVPRLVSRRVGAFTRGVTSGLSVRGYLAFLFEVNEYLPKEHKLTDFQIAKCCSNEFPKRKRMFELLEAETGRVPKRKGRPSSHSVAGYRQKYNKGILVPATGGVRLGPISYRYNNAGDRISRFSLKELSDAESADIIKRYGPERRDTQDFGWKAQTIKRWKKKPKKTTYDSFDWCI